MRSLSTRDPSGDHNQGRRKLFGGRQCHEKTLPIARDELRGVRLTVSRQMVYRSAVVGVLGVYLFVVAALGSLLTYLAVPEETFWGSVIVFASALGLTALLLSDDLRWRIQRFIAVHFYRSKYDAARTVAAFSATLRQEVDLAQLHDNLLSVVQETMQPAHISLWLRPSEHDGKREAPWRTNPPLSQEESLP